MIGIVFTLLKEVLLSVAGKIAFKVIAERFATRLVIYGLEKLQKTPTNDVIDETVEDIILQLKGHKLKVVDEFEVKK